VTEAGLSAPPGHYLRGVTSASLPRVWWFPPAAGLLRPSPEKPTTYGKYDLDAQPHVPHPDPELSWLADEPPVSEWSLDSSDATPQRRLARSELFSVLDGLEPPRALAALAEQPELQRRLRSFTGCYFDLGHHAVPTQECELLLHLVSDQQWVRHWLVLLLHDGSSPVVSTTLPIGFDLPDDWGQSPGEDPVPDVVAVDGSSDLTLTGDSVEEFLYRLWVENEIAFRTREGRALSEPLRAYAAHLGSA
jgi:hypothetical protein